MLRAITNLSSSKLRERNHALDELTSTLKQAPESIPTKLLPQVVQALIEWLDSEHRKYNAVLSEFNDSQPTRLLPVENRLSSIAYVLRLLIEKTCSKFKLKTLKLLLAILPELMIKEGSEVLLEPISVHLTFSLLALVNSELFHLKVALRQWISLVATTCTYLEAQFKISVTDRNVSNLLSILKNLISIDTIGLYQVSLTVHQTILTYLKVSMRQTVNTKLVISIINELILKTHCKNILWTRILIRETWKHIVEIDIANNESIQDELCLFDIYSSELIRGRLPEMVGHGESEVEHFDPSVSIPICLEYILARLSAFKASTLSLEQLSFCSAVRKDGNWFEGEHFQLEQSMKSLAWFRLFGLTKLLISYFELVKSGQETGHILKRRKFDTNLSAILRLSESIDDFLINCIESVKVEQKPLILQILTFYSSLIDIDPNILILLKDAVFQMFEHMELVHWACLALMPIITQNSLDFSSCDLGRLFKLGIPLLKRQDICQMVCMLLVSAMKYTSKAVIEESVLNQIYDLYELSDLSGPSLLCNASLLFWQCLHHYGREFKFRGNKSGFDRIVAWLNSKWNQVLNLSETQNNFHFFIGWLANRCKYQDLIRENSNCYAEDSCNKFVPNGKQRQTACFYNYEYYSWRSTQEQREVLLMNSSQIKSHKKCGETFLASNITSNRMVLNDILYRILGLIEPESSLSSLTKLKWVIQISRVVSHIASNSSYLDYIHDFRGAAETLMRSMRLEDKESYNAFFKLILSPDFSQVNNTLFQKLNMELVMTDYKRLFFHEKWELRRGVNDVDEMFEVERLDNGNQNGHVTKTQDHCNLYIAVEAFLCIIDSHEDQQYTSGLDIILNFLDDLDSDDITNGIEATVRWMESTNYSWHQKSLEHFVRILDEHILQTNHSSSDRGIYILCSFIGSTGKIWLEKINTSLNSDANDILDWVLLRFEDDSFYSVASIRKLAHLLLHMLSFNNLSRFTKGGKQRIFYVFSECLKKLDRSDLINELPEISKYMCTLTHKNQDIIFSEIKMLFELPQQSLEMSAFYSLSMCKMSLVSYSILIASLKESMSYTHYSHTKIYMLHSYNQLLPHLNLKNMRELFEVCKIDILSFWMDKPSCRGEWQRDLWDLDFFCFNNMSSLIESCTSQLAALHFSKKQDNSTLWETIKAITKKSETTLFEESFHLILPLSFVPGGIGEDILRLSQSLLRSPLGKPSTRFILLKWILYFVDFGSSSELATLLAKLHPTVPYIGDLFAVHTSTCRYRFPLYVPLKEGIDMVENRLCELPLSKGEVQYSIFWILSEMNDKVYLAERLRCVRQLKFLFILFEDTLPQCDIFLDMLSELSKYLSELDLHSEVMGLVVCLLRLGYVNRLLTTNALCIVFSSVLIYMKRYDKEVNTAFKNLSKEIPKWALPDSRIWMFCDDVIQGRPISDTVYNSDHFINEKICHSSRLALLSLLFSHAARFSHSYVKETPSRLSVFNLLQSELPPDHLSTNFRLWCAYYLASFENSDKVGRVTIDLKPKSGWNFDDLFENFGSLESFFIQFFDFYESPCKLSAQAKFLCKSLLCLTLGEYSKGRGQKGHFPLQYYDKYIPYCVPMSQNTFTKIHALTTSALTMKEFIEVHFLNATISYSSWISQFGFALINYASLNLPQLRLFSLLLEVSPQFAGKSVPILFNLILYHDHKIAIEWMTSMLAKMQELSKTYEFKEKVTLALSVVSMLRSGYKRNERYSTLAYESLPLSLICQSALLCNQDIFAYMIFEEFSMDRPSDFDSKTLGAIYESIGDSDLNAGLAASHNIAGALQYVNKTEPKSWKAFFLNNAKFDSVFNSPSELERISLLKTSESHGFYGLSASLGKDIKTVEGNNSYRWALQLGDWNLPVSEHIDTKEKGLYSALKKVLLKADVPVKVLEDSMIDIVDKRKYFFNTQEWLDTLAQLASLSNYARSLETIKDAVGTMRKQHAFDNNKLTILEFEDYEINLQSRYLFLMILSSTEFKERRLDSIALKTLGGIELAHFVKHAVSNNAGQDALRKSILLDNLIQEYAHDHLTNLSPWILERLQIYVCARALWECKDFKTPIIMMQGLLQRNPEQSDHGEKSPFSSLIKIPNEEVQSLLVKWTSESRLETASSIFEKYVENFTTRLTDFDVLAGAFNILGDFLNAQLTKLRDTGEIEERKKRCDRGTMESQALEAIYKNESLPKCERRDAERHLVKVRVQLNSDTEILTSLTKQKMEFVKKSLLFYIYILKFTNVYDDDVRDKLCGLWFEHDDNEDLNSLLKKEIGNVPRWKFLPWVNQIASKLSMEDTEFQKALQLTMKRLLYKQPYESLYSVLSIKLYGRHSHTSPANITQRFEAVERILQELKGYDRGTYYSQYVQPLEEFCVMSVAFATTELLPAMKESKKIHLSRLGSGVYWMKTLGQQKIPLATMCVNFSSSGGKEVPRPYIVSVKETVDVSATGVSLPKIMTFTLSDGSVKKILMKGSKDDLRQDAIMEQVFKQVNNILRADKQMRKLDLNIKTYEVIPLGPQAGIIEFVANSVSLNSILSTLHTDDSVTSNEARSEMRKVQTKSNSQRLAVYLKLTKEIRPRMRNFFFNSFFEPLEWFEAKKSYTKGTAVASIVGYILGLGDRHLNNILLDRHSGKPIHIDLGIAFDQGRFLSIPELVPFRLTRDIVDGFGVTGVDGLFRKSCERTYSVLQKNYNKVMHVLNILKWDPLYSWVVSPLKKHKHLLEEDGAFYSSLKMQLDNSDKIKNTEEENQESYRALRGVEEKLIKSGLSVEATIQELIQQASDPCNLSIIYMGWSPFY